jgi:hypothetical protein
LITPQRFDGYSYAENNPIRYSDPTGLSHYLECCDNQACTNFCADDDAPNSNPGGSEGSQKYLVGDPDNSSQSDDSEENEDSGSSGGAVPCAKCTCMEDPDVKKLVEEKEKIWYSFVGTGIGWGLLCIAIIAGAGIGTAASGGALAPAALAVSLGCIGIITEIGMSGELELKKVYQQMDEAGCACAIYCSGPM